MSRFALFSFTPSLPILTPLSTQGEVSLSSNTADVWPHSKNQGFPLIDPFDNLLNGYVSDRVVGMFGSPVLTPPR